MKGIRGSLSSRIQTLYVLLYRYLFEGYHGERKNSEN